MSSTRCLSALALIAAMSTGYAGMAAAQSASQPNATQAQPPAAGEQDGKDATVLPRGSDATAPSKPAESEPGMGAAGRTGTTLDGSATTGSAGLSTNSSAAVTSAAIGKDVLNEAGDTIGEVEDIVTDQSSNTVYAVVSVGGFLGIGDKNVLVPVDELNVGAENVILMSQSTEEDLKALPAYEDDQPGYRSMKDDETGTIVPKQ